MRTAISISPIVQIILRILFICSMMTTLAYAQPTELSYTGGVPSLYTGHSPESSGLTSTITNNEDLYSGALSVSVPLYTLQDLDFQIPIVLTHNTQGVKVNDHPGSVGMNNSLSAHASISVVTNGLPDDLKTLKIGTGIGAPFSNPSTPGYFYNGAVLNSNDWASPSSIVSAEGDLLQSNLNPIVVYPTYYNDLEPDRYIYNIFGQSGEFYYAQDGQFYDLKGNFEVRPILVNRQFSYPPHNIQNIVVAESYQFSSIGGFQLISSDGMQYEFALAEYSYDFFELSFNNRTLSTLHLTKITDLNTGKEVTLDYEQKDFTSNFTGYQHYRFDDQATGYFLTDPHFRLSGRLFNPFYLTSINSPNYRINFNHNETQQLTYPYDIVVGVYASNVQSFINDNSGAPFNVTPVLQHFFNLSGTSPTEQELENHLKWHKLDNIEVFFKSGMDSTLIHTYDFNYNDDPAEKLRLESFGRKDIPLYEMTYNGLDSIPLAYAIGISYEDHEGFYNLRQYPNFTLNSPNSAFQGFKQFRDPVFEWAHAGSLKSLTMPTGARYEYAYDSMTYQSKHIYDTNTNSIRTISENGTGCGLRLKSKTLILPDGKREPIHYEYSDGVLYDEPVYYSEYTHTNVSGSQTFNFQTFSTQSVIGIPDNYERNVSYGKTKIIYPDNGSEEFIYHGVNQDPDEEFLFNTQSNASNELRFVDQSNQRGLVRSKRVYDESQNLLIREDYEYGSFNDSIPEIRAIRINFTPNPRIMDAYAYTIPSPRRRVNVERTEAYFDNSAQPVVRTDTMRYGEFGNFSSSLVLPTEASYRNSDDILYTTKSTYLDEYPDDDIKIALVANMQWQPWKVEQFANYGDGNVLIDGFQNDIKAFSFVTGDVMDVPNLIGLCPVHTNKHLRYEVTWDENDNYSIDTALQYTIPKYDYSLVDGIISTRPAEVQFNGWNDSKYYKWSPSARLLQDSFINYVSTWEYFPTNNQLSKKTYVDGTSMSYTYDNLQRLSSQVHDQCGWSTYYEYHYADGLDDDNFVKDSTYYPQLGLSPGHIVNKSIMDGANRPQQIVRLYQSPDNASQHIAQQTIVYDTIGRPERLYEPFLTSDPSFHLGNQTDFTETYYEASPLQRVDSVRSPQWYSTHFVREVNQNSDMIVDYHNLDGYDPSTLYKSTAIDPNGNRQSTYADIRGLEVARSQGNPDKSQVHTTHTAYDPKGRAIHIYPHNISISSPGAYNYDYYGNDNIAVRDLADADPIRYVYNERDFLAYQQDGMQSDSSRWWGVQYDEYGNVSAEGFYDQSPADNESFAQANITDELIINDYGVQGIVTGKVTNHRSRFLKTDEDYVIDYFYDNCGRPREISNTIFNQSVSFLTYSETPTYDNNSNIIENQVVFRNGDQDINRYHKYYEYDYANRLIEELIALNGKPPLPLSSMRYTAKEQIAERGLGGFLPINYQYLPNRFLTNINSRVFSQQLFYDQPFDNSAITRRNGDISTQVWSHIGGDTSLYHYEYDFKNQITSADYYNPSDPSQDGSYSSDYSYDPLGNLLTINRNGPTTNKSSQLMDQLSFTIAPNSNKIISVQELGNESEGFRATSNKNNINYTYDSNGNIIGDPARGVTNTMNHFNKANRILQDEDNYIDYYYDADGILHRKKIVENGQIVQTRDYLRDIEMIDGDLDMIHFSDGFLRYREGLTYEEDLILTGEEFQDSIHLAEEISSTRDVMEGAEVSYLADSSIIMSFDFEVDTSAEFTARITPGTESHADWIVTYVLRDHLGNTRAVVSDDNLDGAIDTSEMYQFSNYYPFGAEHASSQTGSYAYRYNGKEKELGLDLGLLRFEARDMDPWIGRFRGVDPISDAFSHVSPYNYAENRVPNGIDLWGLQFVPQFDLNLNNGFSSEEKAEFRKGVMQASSIATPILAETAAGFTPAGVALDARDFRQSAGNGDGLGMTLSGIGFVPGIGDLFKGIGKGFMKLFKRGSDLSNPVPDQLSRAIPSGDFEILSLGRPTDSDVFVTGADDINNLNANQISQRLTIPASDTGFDVLTFKTPKEGVASPFNRSDIGFINGGRTAGGAREFILPNLRIEDLIDLSITHQK